MKEIDYNNYFWQENTIRLRALKIEDSEEHYYNQFDTKARLFVNYEVELPPTSNNRVYSMKDYFSSGNNITRR